MPADLKARLKAFVPEPRPIEIAALDQLPATFDIPSETEPVPLNCA